MTNNSAKLDKIFICVGAMKAGTTWLYKNLNQHPEIFFTPEKEIHYFSYQAGFGNKLSESNRITKVNKNSKNLWYSKNYLGEISDSWYINLFQYKPENAYAADFSNQYSLINSDDLRRVYSVAESVRVIYIFRDPLERLWSHIKFQYKFTGKDASIDNLSIKDVDNLIEKPWFWKNTQYLKNYTQLKLVFGDDLKVFFMEDIVSHPREMYLEITKFLDINTSAAFYSQELANENFNATRKVTIPDDIREHLLSKLDTVYAECKEHGLSHKDWSK